jgi:hypothetical protein
MASRTIAYFALLLAWFVITAYTGYGGVSKASDLLAKVQNSWDLHSFLDGIVKKNDGNTYFSFDWGEFDKWSENLQ